MMNINLTCEAVSQRLASDDRPLLLDVREDIERRYCAIADSLHIPMGQIPGRVGELDTARDIVVVCHHGARSFQVAAYLRANGYDRVYNLEGGIDAWSVRIDQSIPRYR